MIRNIYRSPDAPEGGAAPTPEVDSAPAPVETAASPDMTNYVSRDEYSNLESQLNRSEGRAKTAQKLLSVAQQMGYPDMDTLAEALPGMMKQSPQQEAPKNVYNQYPGGDEFYQEQQRPTHREGLTVEDIDSRISERLGHQQAMNTHNLGRDAESKLIASIMTDDNFSSIFEGIEKGEFNSVFDAAYSGAGSAASEIVASAIDNVMYGKASRYGEDSIENLQGKTIPIDDSEVMDQVRDRVVEGLKELAAMSVFAASKKGLQTAPSPEMAESQGTDVPRKDTLEELGENVAQFSSGRFEDLMKTGQPSSS